VVASPTPSPAASPAKRARAVGPVTLSTALPAATPTAGARRRGRPRKHPAEVAAPAEPPRPIGTGVRSASGDVTMYAGFTCDGETFLVGDFVHLQPPAPNEPPYVALLEHVFVRHPADAAAGTRPPLLCEVRWFYRPEDTAAGRLREHGKVQHRLMAQSGAPARER